jgi:4a-hydroxytetrahydrobiopterin dehydratase
MNTEEIKIFNEEEINEWIRNTGSEWSFDGKWIRKTYKTHSWKSTLMVVNAIGHLAELAWHHPDLVVSYAFVEVKLMNHAKKGITQLDFDLAKKIDEFVLWNPVEEGLSLEGTPDDPRFAYVKRKK